MSTSPLPSSLTTTRTQTALALLLPLPPLPLQPPAQQSIAITITIPPLPSPSSPPSPLSSSQALRDSAQIARNEHDATRQLQEIRRKKDPHVKADLRKSRVELAAALDHVTTTTDLINLTEAKLLASAEVIRTYHAPGISSALIVASLHQRALQKKRRVDTARLVEGTVAVIHKYAQGRTTRQRLVTSLRGLAEAQHVQSLAARSSHVSPSQLALHTCCCLPPRRSPEEQCTEWWKDQVLQEHSVISPAPVWPNLRFSMLTCRFATSRLLTQS